MCVYMITTQTLDITGENTMKTLRFGIEIETVGQKRANVAGSDEDS
mgnify:CR=1 FL=1